MAPGRYSFEPSRRSASEPPKFSSVFFTVPRRGGIVGRIWRARGSNNTVYLTGAKPTRVEGLADSGSPLIFIFQNDLSRLQQRFEVGQDARPPAGNRLDQFRLGAIDRMSDGQLHGAAGRLEGDRAARITLGLQ